MNLIPSLSFKCHSTAENMQPENIEKEKWEKSDGQGCRVEFKLRKLPLFSLQQVSFQLKDLIVFESHFVEGYLLLLWQVIVIPVKHTDLQGTVKGLNVFWGVWILLQLVTGVKLPLSKKKGKRKNILLLFTRHFILLESNMRRSRKKRLETRCLCWNENLTVQEQKSSLGCQYLQGHKCLFEVKTFFT